MLTWRGLTGSGISLRSRTFDGFLSRNESSLTVEGFPVSVIMMYLRIALLFARTTIVIGVLTWRGLTGSDISLRSRNFDGFLSRNDSSLTLEGFPVSVIVTYLRIALLFARTRSVNMARPLGKRHLAALEEL